MLSTFDRYDKSYQHVVADSIAFSGLKHHFFLKAKARVLERLFATHFGNKRPAVIDVGCGIGAMHPLLAPLCNSLAGADPSVDCIERARADNPAVSYAHADGQHLPWSNATFDVSLATCVFHHVAPSSRDALVAEMRRVVRPEGLVVIIEHNPWNPGTRLAVARCPFDHDAVLLDWRESRELLRRGGLDRIENNHFLLLPFTGPLSVRIERVMARLPLGAQYMSAGIVQ